MSFHTDNPAAIFPLAGASRRRRRLIVMNAAQHSAAAPPSIPRSSRRPAAPRLSPHFASGEPLSDAERNIAERLRSPAPCTWLFAGENYLDAQTERSWPSLTDRFANALRTRLNRPQDIVVDAARRGGALQDVLSDLDSRIIRRRPDVILLHCGFNESSADSSEITTFESNLLTIARICRAHGVQLVLSTCPVPVRSDDDPAAIHQLVYNEAVRAIAAEWELPIVDHSHEWEHFAIHPGLAGSWFESDAPVPGAIGHARLCESLLAEISIWQAAVAPSSPRPV
mgnify:CR=1 FL=1